MCAEPGSKKPSETGGRSELPEGLSPKDLVTLRALRRSAQVYLLLARLEGPVGEREVGRLLELHPETARRRLKILKVLGLAIRKSRRRGYTLSAAGHRFLAPKSTPDRAPRAINNTNQSINQTKDKEKYYQVEPAPEPRLLPQVQREQADERELWQALGAVNIHHNRRTERLVRMAHLTPEYIQAHYQSLKHRGLGDQPALLLTILESGSPAPELNKIGHLKTCNCLECQRLAIARCPYCGQDPCICSA